MSQLFYLSSEQLERIKPFFPLSHGVSRVDDLRVLSGIIYVIKHGLQWKDAPREYGPYKTPYNRFVRWSRMGIFDNISKKGSFPLYRTHKRMIEFKTPCSLQR